MGSYPGFREGIGYTTTLVVRSRDEARLAEAVLAVEAMLAHLRAQISEA
jgi:hypothetical protein